MITFCINFELSTEWIWMNVKDHFCLSRHLLAIALYPTQQNWKCSHIRNRQYTEFHMSNFWSRRSLGKKTSIFLVCWDFAVQTNSDHKTQKIKLYSVRALKHYLSEKSLIHFMQWQRFQNLVHRFLKRTSDIFGSTFRTKNWVVATAIKPLKSIIATTQKWFSVIQSSGDSNTWLLFVFCEHVCYPTLS